MRANKDAISTARGLFRLCMVNGKLDEDRVRTVACRVAADKPRNYSGILNAFTRLVRLELERREVKVQSAVGLSADERGRIESSLTSQYGEGLTFVYETQAELLGGLKVRVGDDVFDGSVKARLNRLENAL